MRDMALQGVIRGKTIKTTISDKAAPCPLDHVNRQFKAARPCVLWLSDFTYVAIWTALSTLPSSSTPMPAGSWAGGRIRVGDVDRKRRTPFDLVHLKPALTADIGLGKGPEGNKEKQHCGTSRDQRFQKGLCVFVCDSCFFNFHFLATT